VAIYTYLRTVDYRMSTSNTTKFDEIKERYDRGEFKVTLTEFDQTKVCHAVYQVQDKRRSQRKKTKHYVLLGIRFVNNCNNWSGAEITTARAQTYPQYAGTSKLEYGQSNPAQKKWSQPAQEKQLIKWKLTDDSWPLPATYPQENNFNAIPIACTCADWSIVRFLNKDSKLQESFAANRKYLLEDGCKHMMVIRIKQNQKSNHKKL